MKKKYLVIILLIIAVGSLVAYNVIAAKGYDVPYEQPAFTTTSKEITNQFKASSKSANQKYYKKVIVIKGIVSEIHGNSVIIGDSIVCLMRETNPAIKTNQSVSIKGRYIGFDDFMGEIRFDNCAKI